MEGRLEALGDEAPAHAFDGPQAGAQGGDDVFIGTSLARSGICQQPDAGMGELARRSLAGGDQAL
jgi:hypothetical protein